jgi:hypothetical protein
MDRREFLRLTGSATILGFGVPTIHWQTAWAQGTTSLTDLGLPEIKITTTDAGFRVSPSETPAGWTLVTFTNSSNEEEDAPDLMLLPAGMTVEDVISALATPDAAAPSWIYQTTFAGGPFATKGKTTQAVSLLTEGDWLVFSGGEPQLAGTKLTVRATSNASPAAVSIAADVEVSLQEYAFLGLEQPVPAGSHVWKVTNTGQQPHAAAAGGCSTVSVGQSLYLPLALAAGTYGAVCFFPDQETGAPHVLMGMAATFTAA